MNNSGSLQKGTRHNLLCGMRAVLHREVQHNVLVTLATVQSFGCLPLGTTVCAGVHRCCLRGTERPLSCLRNVELITCTERRHRIFAKLFKLAVHHITPIHKRTGRTHINLSRNISRNLQSWRPQHLLPAPSILSIRSHP